MRKCISRFRLLSVLECGIHSVYREHIRAEVRAVVKGEEADAALTDAAKDGIVISAVKEICDEEAEAAETEEVEAIQAATTVDISAGKYWH